MFPVPEACSRCLFRPWMSQDAHSLNRILKDSWTASSAFYEDRPTLRRSAALISMWAAAGSCWAIQDRKTGALMGGAMLTRSASWRHPAFGLEGAELSFWLSASGYCDLNLRQAASSLLASAFSDAALREVTCYARADRYLYEQILMEMGFRERAIVFHGPQDASSALVALTLDRDAFLRVSQARVQKDDPELETVDSDEADSLPLWDEASPVRLRREPEAGALASVPLLGMATRMLSGIQTMEGLRMDDSGQALGRFFHAMAFPSSDDLDGDVGEIPLEMGRLLMMSHILLKLSGLIAERKEAAVVTLKGRKALQSPRNLLEMLLVAFSTRFNGAFLDDLPFPDFSQGLPLVLLQLHRFRGRRLPASYLASLTARAVTELDGGLRQGLDERLLVPCFRNRMLDHMLQLLGVVEAGEDGMADCLVTSTPLLEALFEFLPMEPGQTNEMIQASLQEMALMAIRSDSTPRA